MGSYITSFSTQYGGGSMAGGDTIGLSGWSGGPDLPEITALDHDLLHE